MRNLDSTLHDVNDSLNSTVTASQIDNPYDTNYDDSITEQTTVAQAKDKNKKGQKKKKSKTATQLESDMNSERVNLEDCTVLCKGDCLLPTDSNSESIGCNMCMDWFHTHCVGITDLDIV